MYTSDGESNLESLLQYYHAFEDYPRRALVYLRKAGSFERPLIPESASTYLFEEGRLLKNYALLYEGMGRFNPVWQRDMLVKGFTELAKPTWRAKPETRGEAAESLYALNRGALRQNGIRLPVELAVSGTAPGSKFTETLVRRLKAGGIDVRPGPSRFRLEIRIQGDQEKGWLGGCEIYDTLRGNGLLLKRSIPLHSLSDKAQISEFVRDLSNSMFTYE
jgi:hypothetical protein